MPKNSNNHFSVCLIPSTSLLSSSTSLSCRFPPPVRYQRANVRVHIKKVSGSFGGERSRRKRSRLVVMIMMPREMKRRKSTMMVKIALWSFRVEELVMMAIPDGITTLTILYVTKTPKTTAQTSTLTETTAHISTTTSHILTTKTTKTTVHQSLKICLLASRTTTKKAYQTYQISTLQTMTI